MKTKYYLVPIFGSVDPETLKGPYLTYTDLVRAAQRVRAKQNDEDGLFYLEIGKGKPVMGSFSGADIESDEGEDDAFGQ